MKVWGSECGCSPAPAILDLLVKNTKLLLTMTQFKKSVVKYVPLISRHT